MTLRFVWDTVKDGFDQSLQSSGKQVRQAAAAAIKQAATVAVNAGRQQIKAAGLSRGMVTGYRYKLEKQNGEPTARIFDTLGFISVFEEGEQISGKPLLWLPLSNLPPSVKNLSPKKLAAQVGGLKSINVPGHPPMLGAAIRDASPRPRVTLAKLRKGKNGKRGILQIVPIFVGVPVVNIRKRLNLKQVVKAAAALVPLFYSRDMQK